MLSRYHRQMAAARGEARATWDPVAILGRIPPQLRLFQDQATLRAVVAGRGGGKSYEFAVELLHSALTEPDTLNVYFTTTIKDAREIIWDTTLKPLNEDYALGGKVNETRHEIHFPNRSIIRLSGAKDRYEAQRLTRGRRPRLVIGDEIQNFPSYIKDMVQKGIFGSLLRRGKHGRLILGGTMPEVPVGYWYNIITQAADDGGSEYSLHKWTSRDNTQVGNVEEYLDRMARGMGGWESFRFRREFLNEAVFGDASAGLCFQYNPEVNDYTTLPVGNWHYVLGIDLGFRRDACAIAVIGVCDADPDHAYLVEEWVSDPAKKRITPKDFVDVIRAFEARYRPERMVIDEGNLGAAIADMYRIDFNLDVVAAEKHDPRVGIQFVNADLSSGRLKIKRSSRCAADMAVLRWDPEARERGELKEAKDPHSDIIPAVRYSYKHVLQWMRIVEAPPANDTRPEIERVEDKLNEELEEEKRQAQDRARNPHKAWGGSWRAPRGAWGR